MLKLVDKDLFFDNDDEFYEFAVIPALVIKQSNAGTAYTDFEFTDQYNDAIANDRHFYIKDENSKIAKHKAISYGVLTKPVQNIGEYIV